MPRQIVRCTDRQILEALKALVASGEENQLPLGAPTFTLEAEAEQHGPSISNLNQGQLEANESVHAILAAEDHLLQTITLTCPGLLPCHL